MRGSASSFLIRMAIVYKEVRAMAKAKPCEIIFNTRCGYCMQPIKCKSIAAAIRLTKEEEMAFRIFINGKCIKSGWH